MEAGQEQLRAASRLRLGRERRRPHRACAAAMASPTSETSATSPTTCCSTRRCISWPRLTHRRTSPAQPIFTDNAGPFGGVAGVVEDDPGGEPAPRRPEHQDRVRAHLRRVVPEGARPWHRPGRSSTTDRADATSTTWPISTRRGAPLVYEGIGSVHDAAQHAVLRRSTRAATAAVAVSRVVFSADSRAVRRHGPRADVEVHTEHRQGQLERHVQRRRQQRVLQPGLSGCVRPDARLRLRRVRRPAPALG